MPRGHGLRLALSAAAALAVAPAAAQSDPSPRAVYRSLIESESLRAGVPAEVAEAVLATESGYDPGAIGGDGEIGLMQILPSTARMLGFVGSEAELAAPAVNIRYGVAYLAGAWRKGAQDLCTAAMKYRAGHGETRFSVKSVNYCLSIRSKLAARGYAVTGSVPVATFGEAAAGSTRSVRLGGACRRACLNGFGPQGPDVEALNARLTSFVTSVKMVKLPRR